MQVLRVCDFCAFSSPPALPPCYFPFHLSAPVGRLTYGTFLRFPSRLIGDTDLTVMAQGLLPMVGESPEFLRIQASLTRHLDMYSAQVKPPLGFRPGVEAGFRLLHDVSFPLHACDRSRCATRRGRDGHPTRNVSCTMSTLAVPMRLSLPWYP